MERRLRVQLERNRKSPEGKHAQGYGIRVGYWPCLKAPYIQLAFYIWRLDVWRGLKSYRTAQEEKP